MRRARTMALLIAPALLLGTIASAQRSGEPREAWITSLVAAVRALPATEADVQRMCDAPATPLPSGVTCSTHPVSSYPCTLANGQPGTCAAPGLTFTFDPPMPAAPIVRALGLTEPRIASSDVHQTSWSIIGTRPFEGDRRAGDDAILGVWRARAHSERPSGPLPREHVGPSPAYAVRRATRVTRLSFSLDLEHPHPGVSPRRVR